MQTFNSNTMFRSFRTNVLWYFLGTAYGIWPLLLFGSRNIHTLFESNEVKVLLMIKTLHNWNSFLHLHTRWSLNYKVWATYCLCFRCSKLFTISSVRVAFRKYSFIKLEHSTQRQERTFEIKLDSKPLSDYWWKTRIPSAQAITGLT